MLLQDSNSLLNDFKCQPLTKREYGHRHIPCYDVSDGQKSLQLARDAFLRGEFNQSFDIYEQLSIVYSGSAIEILAELYDQYKRLPSQDRYTLYQSRSYDFGISPKDKVLDIGSGNVPFLQATHLADIAVADNNYGRAGAPFKYIEGKPVFECNIENMPFADKEFDFVYCSHVLEHANNPERACNELMRIGKRGYIETPTHGKDLWMNSAQVSNHKWAVENIYNKLIFTEYTQREIGGLKNNILQCMQSSPQTVREKAFSALLYLRAEVVNTMMLWDNSFAYEVRRIGAPDIC